MGEGLGRFQPDEPRPDDEGAALPACGTCRPARILRELLRFEGVVEGEERRRVGGLVEPVDGRRERDAPRRDQAASVSDAFAVRERDTMPLRVDRNRFIALSEEGRDAHPVVEGGILVPDPVERGLALQQVRYQRAAVHRMRLGTRNGYRVLRTAGADRLGGAHACGGVAQDEVVEIHLAPLAFHVDQGPVRTGGDAGGLSGRAAVVGAQVAFQRDVAPAHPHDLHAAVRAHRHARAASDAFQGVG